MYIQSTKKQYPTSSAREIHVRGGVWLLEAHNKHIPISPK